MSEQSIPEAPDRSEYERYLAVVEEPLRLARRRLEDLDRRAIAELAEQAGLERTHVETLVRSARYSRESALPPELFYGLIRRDLPPQLDRLLAASPDAWRAALRSASEKSIIPAVSGGEIERMIQQLDRLRLITSPLEELAPALGLDPALPLLAHLAERGIRSLQDVRSSGGLAHLADLPDKSTDPAVRVLEAHAALSLLPTDIATATHLVDSGFVNLDEIASQTPETFVAALKDRVPEPVAKSIHDAASIQIRYLDGVLADLRTGGGEALESTPAAATALAAVLPSGCHCEACEDAASPTAYVVDLLDYAVRHLRYQGSALTLTQLESRFHQPFRDLPLSCAAMDAPVRQVRICIEVLRKTLPAQLAGYTPRWFVEAAYLQFLEEIGTSFDELRRAATLDYRQRVALAGKLGLFIDPLHAARPDVLDQLTLDPADPAQLSAESLEWIFGLRDTTRNPLDPDVVPMYLGERSRYLRQVTWWEADWPAGAAPDTPPLVDPDVVGPADMVYAVLTLPGQVGRVPNQPIHFWEDRQKQIRDWAVTIKEVREEPQAGFDALITDRAEVNGRPIQFNVGLGITLQQFADLRKRRHQGEDLSAELDQNRLTVAGFDVLARVWDVLHLNPPGVVLGSEWDDVSDILIQRLKRYSFATWRTEEKALGFALSPQFFKLREPSLAADAEWRPRAWRSSLEARQRWEDTLRSRIDQEQAISDAVRSAGNAVEEALLGELRNELIRLWALPGLITLEKLTALTQQLQIDCEAGVCQVTTRISQAIETIQGVLFGARNGLLEDGALTLNAPGFDQEWQWMGSYASWHAAMQVFLYPENAIRPILRRDKSVAFQRLITELQRSVPVSPEQAQKAADAYAEYFQDVCSLTLVAVYETDTWPASASGLAGRRCLVVARGGRSAKLYFAAFDQVPAWYLNFVPGHTMWAEIEGLPINSEIVGFLPYQPRVDEVHVGLYVRHEKDGVQTLLFADYDGQEWQRPQTISELPALITSAEYSGGVIPADSALGATGAIPGQGWPIRGDDRLIPLYAEGLGSTNRTAVMVVAGQPDADGRRRVGLLRRRDGGLVLTAFATIDGQWDVAGPEPILLWHNGIQRVVLTRPDGPLTQLGLLSTNWPQDGTLSVVWQTTDGFVRAADGSGWPVHSDAPLAPASLDNVLATSLLALDYETTMDQNGWRDRSTRTFVLRPEGRGLQLQAQFLVNNPYHEGVGLCASETHVQVTNLMPIRFAGYETVFALGVHEHRYAGGLPCTISAYANVFCWELDWDWQAARLRTHGGVPQTNASIPTLKLARDDGFLVVELPNGSEGALLLPTPTHPEIAIIAHRTSNPEVTWQSTAGAIDPVGPGTLGAWPIRPDDRYYTLGLTGQRRLLVARADGSEITGLRVLDGSGKLGVDWRVDTRVRTPGGTSGQGWPLAAGARYVGLEPNQSGPPDIFALAPDGRLGLLRSVSLTSPAEIPPLRNIGPINVAAREIVHRNSRSWLADRKALIESAYLSNESPSLRRYLDEAYFFVPMQIAQRLRESGYYTAALDWLRSIYDYVQPMAGRKISYRLVVDEHPNEPDVVFDRDPDWVRDPINPHAIAETRRYSYLKFILLAIAGCFQDFADAEFTRATAESVPRARELYLEALELLSLPEIRPAASGCAELIGQLTLEIGEDELRWVWQEILLQLDAVNDLSALASAVTRIKAAIETDEPLPDRLAAAQVIVQDTRPEAEESTYSTRALHDRETRQRAQLAVLADPATTFTALRLGGQAELGDGQQIKGFGHLVRTPAPSYSFCIRPNPVIQAARSHAEMNLRKIRTCRNIAGLDLHLDPYAMPTAAEASLDFLATPSSPRSLQPLPYRYAVLIERAKQLVQLSQQIESSMLGSLQSLGLAQYEAIKARQDLTLAQAGVRMKDLQLAEANDGIATATVQRQRAELQANHYRRLLDEGLSLGEDAALGAMAAALAAQTAGLYSVETLVEWAGAAAPVFGRLAELSSTVAGYDRRAQEWGAQRDLAVQDIRAGQQQIQLAYDRTRIAAQDRAIAALQAQHAAAMVDFIETQKFGSEALYEWMSGVLEQIYRFFLQQATSVARIAEAQLAFERQEVPPAVIQADYWEAPASTNPPQAAGQSTQAANVHGLTGSARLLRDIYELDQHAFATNQRKLQLTETISLAQVDPIAFQRFRQSGVLPFATPMAMFDQRFPGHYLRLIRRVRTSVIALVPPTQGIRATLATTGTSRVVIGGTTFQKVAIQRGPESVALTSPMNNSGVFDLDPQPELLVPFEGIGVETSWEFRLPKPANQLDFDAIADVLITIDYTALDSADYRQQVLQDLDPRFRADRPFSFRRDFPDAWYDLHNSELLPDAEQFVVRFRCEREDFPPNLDGLTIDQVVLYFATHERNLPIGNVTLQFTPDLPDLAGNRTPVEGDAQPVGGKISTRAGAWTPLIGQRLPGLWMISLRPADNDPQKTQKLAAIRAWFASEAKERRCDDIILAVSYSARTPAWPAR